MKNLVAMVSCATLLASSLAGADEVVSARTDRVVGGGFAAGQQVRRDGANLSAQTR